jgi:hypothetical protein
MYNPAAPGTRLYRVTGLSETWPNPLLGLGAYFTRGGRYNRPHQQTVYASDDPLVAITEAAFYQALDWQRRIGLHHFLPVGYPLESEHWLWCFTIDPGPPVIDLLHLGAQHQFLHPPHLLLAPSQQYEGTQALADTIRAYIPPPGSLHPRPEGLRAPSVRALPPGKFQPTQFALFVMDPAIQQPYTHRATLVEQWKLTFEFQEPPPRRAVTYNSARIDWRAPRFRLGGPSMATIPAFTARPHARPFRLGRWYRVAVNFGYRRLPDIVVPLPKPGCPGAPRRYFHQSVSPFSQSSYHWRKFRFGSVGNIPTSVNCQM